MDDEATRRWEWLFMVNIPCELLTILLARTTGLNRQEFRSRRRRHHAGSTSPADGRAARYWTLVEQ